MRPSLSFCTFQCSVFWICSIVLLSASLYVEIMHTGRLFSASLWCYWCLCSRLLMPLLQTSDATDVTAVQSFYATDVNAADFWCLCSRLLMIHQMFLSAFLSLVIFQGGLCWDHHMQTEIYRDHTCCAALYFSVSASLWFYCTLWMPRHSFWCHIPSRALLGSIYANARFYQDVFSPWYASLH